MALQPCNTVVSVTGTISHLTMVSWSWDDIFFSSYIWTDPETTFFFQLNKHLTAHTNRNRENRK